jgi:hypothetical protein
MGDGVLKKVDLAHFQETLKSEIEYKMDGMME